MEKVDSDPYTISKENGSWHVYYFEDGRKYRQGKFDNKREAETAVQHWHERDEWNRQRHKLENKIQTLSTISLFLGICVASRVYYFFWP